MRSEDNKHNIQAALNAFGNLNLTTASKGLFESLGYFSKRDPDINGVETFKKEFKPSDKAETEQWKDAAVLFQLADEDVRNSGQVGMNFTGAKWDKTEFFSYVFMAIELKKETPSRTWLANVTRAVNRSFAMPVLIAFKYGSLVSLAIIDRRLGKRDETKDVLEKVTLIKDIRFTNPHRAHIEILNDLSLPVLASITLLQNFKQLHDAWRKALDQKELNKRFFKDIANWYFWALRETTFPADAPKEDGKDAISLIRLITRLIFCWFIKEKGLIPDALFEKAGITKLLKDLDPQKSTYYRAILQNLFFATLNSPMNEKGKAENRRFCNETTSDHMIHSVWRHRRLLADEDAFLEYFKAIPYLNGGLFECLDTRDEKGEKRIDGFSSKPDKCPDVPNELFFGAEREMDLGKEYGTGSKKEKVRGLLETLSHYKFTVSENTPLEEEVALDPELLGQVFENLLAAYNPETGTTARKKTGSFYTPRPVVDFMVEQALLKRWTHLLTEECPASKDIENRLKLLLAFEETENPFNAAETQTLISIIDSTKVVDPACGSGAFLMGILHRMVRVLSKLDPQNKFWKQRQLENQERTILNPEIRDQQIDRLEEIFQDNDDDYGRKLFLLENCIFGVDIQAIAVQIAKLRCFISLVVDQRVDDKKPNRGVLELPNLETRFVAANTLIGLKGQRGLRSEEVIKLEKQLSDTRHLHFTARSWKQKKALREKDRELSAQIAKWLKDNHAIGGEEADALVHWNPYDQNASAGVFDPEWMFGLDVAAKGFDVVIGNPPYVRQEKIRDLKPKLEGLYPEVYTGTADLYVYFYARSIQLLATGGVISFISSNKYFRSGYGKKLRKFLNSETKLSLIIDFGDADVFEGTVSYPSIFVAEKGFSKTHRLRVLPWDQAWDDKQFVKYYFENNFEMWQKDLTEDGWRFENPQVLALFEKIKKGGAPLDQVVKGRFYYGIKTGFNDAFIVDNATKERLIKEDKKSAELLKSVLRGRDIKRWKCDSKNFYLIRIESSLNKKHPWSGLPEKQAVKVFSEHYPAIAQFLFSHRTALKKREDQGEYFWELRSCAYWDDFLSPKIIYPDIAKDSSFCWDSSGHYLVNTLYMIPDAPLWLLAFLNSKLAFWYYSRLSNQIQGGFVRYLHQYLEVLPIPRFAIEDTKSLIELVEKIGTSKIEDRNQIEEKIDQIVFKTADLTDSEIKLLLNSLPNAVDAKRMVYSLLEQFFEKEKYMCIENLKSLEEYESLEIEDSSLQRYLQTAISEGRFFDAGKGWYSILAEPLKLDPTPVTALVDVLKTKFPALDFACWSTQQLTPYVQNLMAKHISFVSTDRGALETVGQVLEAAGYTVHVNPGKTAVGKIVGGAKVVVLQPSFSREPQDGHFAPPEKVLVDLFFEAQELGFMDRTELATVIKNILGSKRLSISELFAYLERRSKKSVKDTGFLKGAESLIATFTDKVAIKD